jgi:hypothetical protein
MKMKILGCVSAILLAGTTLWWVSQYQSKLKLREENQALREQVEQLAVQNERASNATAQAVSSQSLTKNQLGELLRLRGEVGRLRKETQELAKLREENQQLRAAMTASQSVYASELRPGPDYWPKDSWVFAGYATPESTLQSLLWLASKRDIRSFLASTTGEAQKHLEDDLKQKSEAEVAAELAQETEKLSSCRLLDKEYLSNDAVRLTVRMDGDHTQTNRFILKKIGNEWKFGGDE